MFCNALLVAYQVYVDSEEDGMCDGCLGRCRLSVR